MADDDETTVQNLVTEIEELVPPSVKPHNIFVFGRCGFGKTSFLNTSLITFGSFDQVVQTFGESTQKGQNSVTVKYNSYKLPRTNVHLFDTYGWEIDPVGNYNARDFARYLQGFVPLLTSRPKGTEPLAVSTTLNASLSISAVVFLVAANACTETEFPKLWNGDEKALGLKTFYEECKTLKVTTQFAISQLDIVLPETRTMLYDNIIAYQKFRKLKAVIEDVIPKEDTTSSVWPLISYTADEIKTKPKKPLNFHCAAQIVKSTIKEIKKPVGLEWNMSQMSLHEQITPVAGYHPSLTYPSVVPANSDRPF